MGLKSKVKGLLGKLVKKLPDLIIDAVTDELVRRRGGRRPQGTSGKTGSSK